MNLFINACVRTESRTEKIAEKLLEKLGEKADKVFAHFFPAAKSVYKV